MPSLLFSSGFMQNNSSSNSAIGRMFAMGLMTDTDSSNNRNGRSIILPGYNGGGYQGIGYLFIMKGTVPTNLSTITGLSQRSADILVTYQCNYETGGNFSPSINTYYQNPGLITTSYVAAAASGTASWFWIIAKRVNEDALYQQIAGTVGVTGSGADLEIASTTINTGQQIRVVNLRFVLPTTYTY